MKTKTINIRKLSAGEGNVVVSKAMVEDPDTGMKVPEVWGKDIFLGIEAKEDDFEEKPEAEVLEMIKAAVEAKDAFYVEQEALKEAEEKEEEEPVLEAEAVELEVQEEE